MNQSRREPTREELQAMAYVDGELDGDERRAFEARMSAEPALGREVAELRGLALMARGMAPPEPTDHEWERLRSGAVHQVGSRLGLFGLGSGALALLALALWSLLSGEASLPLKLAVSALASGALILFAVVLRSRLAQLPYDPYTKVQR